MPIINSSFRPAWWLRNRHAQTVFGTLFRKRPRLALRRERWERDDGDFVDLDWLDVEQRGDKAEVPLLVLLHGLEGSSQSHYIRGQLKACQERGWRAVVMHFRGCSGEHNRLPTSYHSGATEDIRDLLLRLQQQGEGPLLATGFSLGGNVLLKYLGEQGRRTPLKAACAVSVPLKLDHCATVLSQGFSRRYERRLVGSLRAKTLDKFRGEGLHRHLNLAPSELQQLNTFWQFDERVTAPLHQFAGAQDYYAKASSFGYLKAIQVPVLLLQAMDDPFLAASIMPEERHLSPSVVFERSPSGGHVGFISGASPLVPEYYLDKRLTEFLANNL